MLKAVVGRVLFLGLTPENVALLEKGRPILVDSRELGFPDGPKIVLCYGESPQAILDEIRREAGVGVGPDTRVVTDLAPGPRKPS